MAILNYTTKIDPIKTIGEIQQILVKQGVRKIVTDYDPDGLPIGVTFTIELDGRPLIFALPCNWEGVLNALQKDHKVPKSIKTKEQALRTSWRILKDWVEAQMALVQAQLASVTEVFLPYAVTRDGSTLYRHITEKNPQLLLGN
jgi:hypothetical protein